MSTYLQGTPVTITATFFDVNGVAADPTSVSVRVQLSPGATPTTHTFATSGVGGWTKTGTSTYSFVVATDTAIDQVTCLWSGTGAVTAPGVWTFNVVAPPF